VFVTPNGEGEFHYYVTKFKQDRQSLILSNSNSSISSQTSNEKQQQQDGDEDLSKKPFNETNLNHQDPSSFRRVLVKCEKVKRSQKNIKDSKKRKRRRRNDSFNYPRDEMLDDVIERQDEKENDELREESSLSSKMMMEDDHYQFLTSHPKFQEMNVQSSSSLSSSMSRIYKISSTIFPRYSSLILNEIKSQLLVKYQEDKDKEEEIDIEKENENEEDININSFDFQNLLPKSYFEMWMESEIVNSSNEKMKMRERCCYLGEINLMNGFRFGLIDFEIEMKYMFFISSLFSFLSLSLISSLFSFHLFFHLFHLSFLPISISYFLFVFFQINRHGKGKCQLNSSNHTMISDGRIYEGKFRLLLNI